MKRDSLFLAMLTDVTLFLLCAALIFFSGKKLSYYGDVIAEKSGLGKIWVGLLLMATVTSLPELITGISSVRVVGSADLAVGNVLGSCVFNLAILSLLDALIPKEPLFIKVEQTQVLAATLGTILLAMVGVGLFLDNVVILGWIGLMSFLFILVYFASIKLLHRFTTKSKPQESPTVDNEQKKALQTAIGWYSFHALIVIAASLFLPVFGENIAIKSGLGETFIGTLLLAASTSLPEMAISLSAVRRGSVDIAVGNLFGSNIFNVFTLAIDDLFYTKGDLLKVASESHIISIFSTIIMTSVAVVGLTFRSSKKRFVLALDTL
ncbi:MAG TPA: hypothetical protein VFW11_08390, partial [Cyclobacteriaceae bacterium]|nr:hypothetical protein [Cyclobacteriaceae bacterium]